MEVRVAFWNVYNLFPVGVVDRGPKTDEELAAKLDALADCANGFFEGRGADVLGLAEVATEPLLRALLSRLQGEFQYVWAPPNRPQGTGLAFVYRTTRLANATTAGQLTGPKRPWTLQVEAEVSGSANADPTAVFAVAHWKSRFGESAGAATAGLERCEAADWLADQLDAGGRGRSVVAMGDFNAEPFEAPFHASHLAATRLFSTAIRSTRLYATAWKLFPEPRPIEEYREPAFQLDRPVTSHDGDRVLFDHLLVGGGALRGGPLLLREQSVRYYWDPKLNAARTRIVIKPLRFEFDPATGARTGASDHFPLLAEFTVN